MYYVKFIRWYLYLAGPMSLWLLWWPPTGSSMFMVVVMLLMNSVLHCLYSVGNKITTTTNGVYVNLYKWMVMAAIPMLLIITADRLHECNFIHSFNSLSRGTHMCVSKLTIIGSDNGLSPGRRQAIIWTNSGILLIRPLGTNFNEMLIEILTFSFMKMHLKVSSAKLRPFCLGLNVLII